MTTLNLTTLPNREEINSVDKPRSGIGKATPVAQICNWGSVLAGLGISWIICKKLLPLPGLAWLVIVASFSTILVTATLTWLTDSTLEVFDRVVTTLVYLAAAIVGLGVLSTIIFVFQRGWQPLLHLNFWFDDMSGVGPRDPLTEGGIGHAILGSLIEVGLAVLVTLPLGIGTAVFMNEVGGRTAQVVRTVVDAMTALPSVVAGLFIYTTVIIVFGMPRSGFAASLALTVMMLPIIARAADVVLRVVPSGLREASLALGASRWKTVWNVVLPTARPGLATALILGIARGVGETSPVLLTSGAAAFFVTNPTSGVMNSLPLFIFSTVRSGEPLEIERAFGAAALLMILVLTLFVVARRVARTGKIFPFRLSGLLNLIRRIKK